MTTLQAAETTDRQPRVVWEAFPSWALFTWLYLVSALAALRAAVFHRFGVSGWEAWGVGAGLLLICAAVLRRWAHYELSRDRITVRNGYTGREMQAVALTEVEAVDVQQGPVAAFFRIGTVAIHVCGQDRLMLLRGVRDPEEVRMRIQSLVRKHGRAT